MMSLLDLISQNQPHFQTHQALLVIGLQNDFIQPDGKLPVDDCNGFLDRIHTLIPKFRQLSANVIWVQTLYETDRFAGDPTTGESDAVVVGGLVDGPESSTDDDDDLPKELIPQVQSRSSRHKQRALDLLKRVSARQNKQPLPRKGHHASIEEDEELFLLQASRNGPACLPNTPGADFTDSIKPSIEQSDTVLRTTNYSAFVGTSLLLILRAKLVTELYICGCMTNVSVLATVGDAARHGIRINVVEDCLGFRKQARHDEALRKMVDLFDANVINSQDIHKRENEKETPQRQRPSSRSKYDDDEGLEDLIGNLQLNERPSTRRQTGRQVPTIQPDLTNIGRQRTLSDTSAAESRATTDTKLSDEQFAEKLTQGAKIHRDSNSPQPAAKQNLVKSKIRMRPRADRTKKDDAKHVKGDSGTKAESSSRVKTAEPTNTSLEKPPKEADTSTKRDTAPPPATNPPRPTAITKAESSDRLRESPPSSKREQALKTSASHPILSTPSPDNRESKSSSTRSAVRQALQRSSKSESTQVSRADQADPDSKVAKPTPTPSQPSAKKAPMGKKVQSLASFPVLRPGDRIAEGDSKIIYDFFRPKYRHPSDPSKPLRDVIFYQLYNEVRWQKMLHQTGEVPRLVCCQGEFGADGSMPVYRHPTDHSLPLMFFSPKVQVIRKQAEKLAGHPLNHVLIQLYRSGNDYISEHSDKTLDIVRGSSIVNVSFGAQRTMRLRTKKSSKRDACEENQDNERETQRVAMPHNSMFVLGLESNKKWLHGIMADKRIDSERSEAELGYSGIRISLTFRQIGTFLDAENSTIWGQGATSKKQNDAQDVINEDEEENEKVVRAFSKENHQSDFDWEEEYGDGFDVLHFRNAPDDLPILFASNNVVETRMVQIFLAENKINHTFVEAPILEKPYELDRQVCFRDNDVNHTEAQIAVPILIYLDRYYPLDRDDRGRTVNSRSYEVMVMVMTMLKYWMNRHVPTYYSDFINMAEQLEEKLDLGQGPFIAGRRFSIGDCAAWPVLDEVIRNWEDWSEERFPALGEYHKMLWKKKKSVSKLREELPSSKKNAEKGATE